MKLETLRLILRTHKTTDAKDLAKALNNIKVARYISSIPHPYTLKMAREFIQKSKRYAKEKNPKSINFAIELKSEKKLVGGIGLHKIDYIKKTVSIGSWLRENLWGRGIASEATKEIIDFVFYKLRFKKIELTCSEDNNASPAIAKKFGFKLKEIIKNGHASISTGKTTDKYCYELSKQNWIEWGKK